MHIACCENCRYLDLYEVIGAKCPRCGDRMVSLGIESSHWNEMSEEARKTVIAERFPRAEDNENIHELFAEPVKGREVEPEPEEEPEEYEYVYVCYKCSAISAHDGKSHYYYCPECGASMVEVGYTTVQWAEFSKEEKRQLAEEAKIDHMVNAIKEAKIKESEEPDTAKVIKVVKN